MIFFYLICSLFYELLTIFIMTMEIKVLGTGCPKCKRLEQNTREAVAELGIEANVTKEEDIVNIMQYNILHTPGLVINEIVVLSGRLASQKEIKELITRYK